MIEHITLNQKIPDEWNDLIVTYLLENNNTEQVYVGKTIDLYRRTQGHIYGKEQWIDKAISSHGKECFSIKILEVFDEYDKDLLNEREKYWIEKYNAFEDKNHYNLTLGADGADKGKNNVRYRHDLDDNIIIDMYVNQKLNIKDIADELNTNFYTIKRRLKANGIKLRNRSEVSSGKNNSQYRHDINDEIIIDMYVNQKLSTYEIADILDTSSTTIRRRLKANGIKLRKIYGKNQHKYRHDLDDNIIIDMYVNQHLSTIEIANKLNVCATTIKNRLVANGIKMRGQSEAISGKNHPGRKYTIWDISKVKYNKNQMFRQDPSGKRPKTVFSAKYKTYRLPIGNFIDFTTPELISDLITEFKK